jgi:hypothetical protein
MGIQTTPRRKIRKASRIISSLLSPASSTCSCDHYRGYQFTLSSSVLLAHVDVHGISADQKFSMFSWSPGSAEVLPVMVFHVEPLGEEENWYRVLFWRTHEVRDQDVLLFKWEGSFFYLPRNTSLYVVTILSTSFRLLFHVPPSLLPFPFFPSSTFLWTVLVTD